ncbi:BRCA1-associated protein [Halyomorpha halys]|uniref:BRCA1-associated protein n=1 Tax=Halyomorpha halys TaxID=286706 RepID=UPI0006D515FE|nr:BRCA1-associated protein [Halyomorpha halys]
MPSVDVSLCVVRIETSQNSDLQKNEGSFDLNARKTIPLLRGRRKARNIDIQTLCILNSSMAEGVENIAKPVCSNGTVERVPIKTIIEGKAAKEVLQFVSGNPFVEKTHGIIHLFKENELTNIDRASFRSQTLCILAIPVTMNCSELLRFLEPCKEEIKHIRIIRDSSPNQYMSLITFRSPESVQMFYQNFNGIPFTSMDPDWCCHLVFVSKVETISEIEGGSIAPVSHTELPTCPVCLERMDESVDGILTILCNHAFHGNCLAKWGDTSCPVCRYVQTPEPNSDSHCLECMASESLWICLICGHVGCGRYLQGHAYQHYIDTQHCYSMQVGSNSVWDYVGDNFVHRLLQNKADGKLVEGPSQNKSSELEAKLENVQLEYTYLLSSQLESQRMYYEKLVSDLEKRTSDEISDLKEKVQNSIEQTKSLNDNVNVLSKEKSNLEKKLQNMSSKLTSAYKQLQEEKELNNAMRTNQTQWQDKYNVLEKEFEKYKSKKEDEVIELKDQLRDVMFFLEAEKVVNSSPHKNELKEGKMEVGKPASNSKSHRHGRKH